MYLATLLISLAATAISLASLYFTFRAWRSANRPFVVATVETHTGSGNVATLLELKVRNCGNRPALNVRLTVDDLALAAALVAPPDSPHRPLIERCFSDPAEIPILVQGESTTNSFGEFNLDAARTTWKTNALLDVVVLYGDFDGRRFRHPLTLRLADNCAFARSSWSKPASAAE